MLILYRWQVIGIHLLLATEIARSYVLLTANIEDLKKLARKFVSEDLAEKIVDFLTKVGEATLNLATNISKENEENDIKIDHVSKEINILRQGFETTTENQPKKSTKNLKKATEPTHDGDSKTKRHKTTKETFIEKNTKRDKSTEEALIDDSVNYNTKYDKSSNEFKAKYNDKYDIQPRLDENTRHTSGDAQVSMEKPKTKKTHKKITVTKEKIAVTQEINPLKEVLKTNELTENKRIPDSPSYETEDDTNPAPETDTSSSEDDSATKRAKDGESRGILFFRQ